MCSTGILLLRRRFSRIGIRIAWASLKMWLVFLRVLVLACKCLRLLVPLIHGHACSIATSARVSMLLKECVTRYCTGVWVWQYYSASSCSAQQQAMHGVASNFGPSKPAPTSQRIGTSPAIAVLSSMLRIRFFLTCFGRRVLVSWSWRLYCIAAAVADYVLCVTFCERQFFPAVWCNIPSNATILEHIDSSHRWVSSRWHL